MASGREECGWLRKLEKWQTDEVCDWPRLDGFSVSGLG